MKPKFEEIVERRNVYTKVAVYKDDEKRDAIIVFYLADIANMLIGLSPTAIEELNSLTEGILEIKRKKR